MARSSLHNTGNIAAAARTPPVTEPAAKSAPWLAVRPVVPPWPEVRPVVPPWLEVPPVVPPWLEVPPVVPPRRLRPSSSPQHQAVLPRREVRLVSRASAGIRPSCHSQPVDSPSAYHSPSACRICAKLRGQSNTSKPLLPHKFVRHHGARVKERMSDAVLTPGHAHHRVDHRVHHPHHRHTVPAHTAASLSPHVVLRCHVCQQAHPRARIVCTRVGITSCTFCCIKPLAYSTH
jgi:hypothetical protein